jgi:hypothetical protein
MLYSITVKKTIWKTEYFNLCKIHKSVDLNK